MSVPPPLPDSSRWWKFWIAAVVVTPMVMVGVMAASDKFHGDLVPVAGFGVSILLWGYHIYVSAKLAKAIASERLARGQKASIEGLIIGLLFGGWAVMFALFFCGCLAVMFGTMH